MIVRIVRMHFMPDAVDEFLDVYGRTEAAILHSEGCIYLELLRDTEDPNVFVTISHWESSRALDNYRKSELFKKVWRRAKTHFSKSPQAFSMEKYSI